MLGNFQCRGGHANSDNSGTGAKWAAVGADGGSVVWIFFSRLSTLFLSPSHCKTTRKRLKYCLKELLHPKQPNQPTFTACPS